MKNIKNVKKKIIRKFDILYSFDLSKFACCTIINPFNNHKFNCFHINTGKNQCLNNTQIRIRFYDLFQHLNMLLRCKSDCYWLNINHLITSRHKWLTAESKFNEQFFLMKNLVWWIWILDYSTTDEWDSQKKHSKVLY